MIRLATIGTSDITHRLAAAVDAVPGIAITHAYSRNAGRAAELAAQLDAQPASDLGRLLASPDIDAVYVGTPNSAHHDQVLAAVRAGKHVLVEKPAAPTAAEWSSLATAAQDSGVVLLEAMRTAYDPGLAAVLETLPLLGPIRRVSLRYEKRSSRYDQVLAGETVNIFDPAMAGGALLDLGVYCAHALIYLFGEPIRVTGASVGIASGADGAGVGLVTYPGFVADLNYSKITTSTLPSEIQGELATLLIDRIDKPRSLTVQFSDGDTQTKNINGPVSELAGEVERFAHLIQTGEDPTADHFRTLLTLRVVEAIRASR